MKKMMNKYSLLLITVLFAAIDCADAQNINIPNKTGPMGLQVNTLTGNLFFTRNDLYIPARGFAMNVSFYYNSFNFDINDGYGNGWSFDYNIKYRNDTLDGKVIIWGDGREDRYRATGNGAFASPTGFFNSLAEYQPGKYRITETDGTKYFFDNSTHKRITRMEEPNGNFISFAYTDTLLTALTSSAGQSISLAYTNGRLTNITDAITTPARSFSYTYDGAGNLTQVKDPLNNANKYTYLVNGPMKAITDKNNNKVDIIYFNNFTISELIGCNKRISLSYDTSSLTTVVTDHLTTGDNQVTQYKFKRQERSTWLSSLSGNCCGFNMKFEFDNNGNKIKETDANGNVTRFTYDSRGNMLTTTDALNQTITYTYTSDYNRVASFTDEKGFITAMAYDTKGNLTQITEPGNLVYTATYAANGDIISSTDPRGNTFTYTYDTYGNPVSATGPGGFTAQLVFDARGNLLSVTDARGNTNNLEYDILGRLKKIIDPLNNNVQVSYDAEGNPVMLKNENNETSYLAFDASNRPVEITDPVGGKTAVTYDAMNNIKSVTNPMGNKVSFEYDNRNRIKKLTDPQGNMLTASYDANGNPVVVNMPGGQQLNYSYDPLNRVTSVADLTGTILSLTYDKNGNATGITNSNGATQSVEYDNLNRIKKLTDPLGNSYRFTYDNNGNVTTVTDRTGFTSNYTYDSLDRLKTIADNNGNTVAITYDAESNVVALKDQNNNTTNYTYDNINRLKRTTYPDGRYIENTYDNKSNIIARRITDGTIFNFVYDTLNRVASKTLPDGQVFTYTYDALGRVLTASNNAGTVTLTYDALNRISSETFGNRTVQYSYNVSGRIQTTVYPDGTTVAKSYDTRNRLSGITKDNELLVTYQYNSAGQLVSKTMANGITTDYQYDFAGRLTNISTAGGTIQNSSFTYNNERQKTSINRLNDPAASEQFTYDNSGRLTNYKRGIIGGSPVVQNTYTYDALGNRTSANLNGTAATYTSNSLNQLVNSNTGAQNINFTYDANGNLTYDGQFYKSYDAEKRLVKDSSSPATVFTYQYDAFGRRVRKNLNGTILNYTFAGIAPIEERDNNSGAVINKTIFAGFLTPVVNEKNNQQFFYHQNELNSVEAISNRQGRLLEKYQYDVYGKMNRYDSLNNPLPGSLAGNRFGFTGQVYDSATGRYKFFFREYNPETGLFNQRDLIGYADGMGMYQYVHNDPANGVDILGLSDCDEKGKFSWGWAFMDGGLLSWLRGDYLTKARINSLQAKHVNIIEKEIGSLMNKLAKANDVKGNPGKYYGRNYLMPKEGLNTNGTIAEIKNSINAAKAEASGVKTLVNDLAQGKTLLSEVGTVAKAGGKALGVIGTVAVVAETGVNGANTIGATVDWVNGNGEFYDVAMNGTKTIESAGNISPISGTVNAMSQLISGKTLAETSELLGEDFTLAGYIPLGKGVRKISDMTINNKDAGLNTDHQNFLEAQKKANRVYEPRWSARRNRNPCPPNGGGTQRPPRPRNPDGTDVEAVSSDDPNEIIGPDGQPGKHWVSIKDRLPYTILYENALSASAPAKYVKIISPIEPKEDAATFQLGSFGFNTLTFSVPPNTASYYQRLDARDSLGLYVDVTAGYDQVGNQAFWEFQAIDPLTLLPPTSPLKGFLLLQDSTKPLNGHGFVNFSIKPLASSLTLDTIGARASIVFDSNDTIPTNIYTNTIDAFAPTSHLNPLPANSSNPIHLSWTGTDDTGGCGISYYTIYISTDQVSFRVFIPRISSTDTLISLPPDSNYCFFVLATDRVGNKETLRPGEIQCSYVGTPLPVTWLYFNGKTVAKDNLLEWATANEQNSKQFDVERSLTGTSFTRIGVVNAKGNSSQTTTYGYTDYNIDRLGSEVMFYRLKQIDLDGRYKYSTIVRLRYSDKNKVNSIIYPNPTQGSATMLVGDNALVGSTATVYDINGRQLASIKITANSQTIDFGRYVNGIYFIRLVNGEVLRVIKQ